MIGLSVADAERGSSVPLKLEQEVDSTVGLTLRCTFPLDENAFSSLIWQTGHANLPVLTYVKTVPVLGSQLGNMVNTNLSQITFSRNLLETWSEATLVLLQADGCQTFACVVIDNDGQMGERQITSRIEGKCISQIHYQSIGPRIHWSWTHERRP